MTARTRSADRLEAPSWQLHSSTACHPGHPGLPGLLGPTLRAWLLAAARTQAAARTREGLYVVSMCTCVHVCVCVFVCLCECVLCVRVYMHVRIGACAGECTHTRGM